MPNPIRLCLVLHIHQPVGNFHDVFEQSYQDSYLPFLNVFEEYQDLRISLHTSGPLMEWLDAQHSDYLDRLARLVAQGRVEIIGGPFYEPIMTMIPSRDRVGQIRTYTQWLNRRLGADVQGMWMPERVWEQALTTDLANAGIRYTLLDDFHFKHAGVDDDRLHGYYLTENDGDLVSVFPGSEHLRYTIPFADPQATIDYLRGIADQHANAVVTFGDDGEKFGTWPDTKQHVYENGWLRRFFDALCANRDWLFTTTLAEAVDSTPSLGRVYLPECSYREMTEWALPVHRQLELEDTSHELHEDPRWSTIQRYVRGGFWRNFKVKYPETNEMYTRMIAVSRRLQQAEQAGLSDTQLSAARRELYRGQCNCSYWHGAFGGVYLPHLRHAVFNHLIAADNLLDEALGRGTGWIDCAAEDFNLDGRGELQLANEKLICLIAPHTGGQIYELDVRPICLNVLSTLSRRQEAYHRKVLCGPSQDNGSCASIHDRVVFKQEGLDQRVQYDNYSRKTLVDHFLRDDETLQNWIQGKAHELGSFVQSPFEATLRRSAERLQVKMTSDGHVESRPIRITKGVTMEAGSSELEIVYLIEGLPQDRTLHFAVELNFAGLPAGADDRHFTDAAGNNLGQLGSTLDLQNITQLGLIDQWQGIHVQWSSNQPTNVWTMPIETVSQSEGGFELVHQSVAVLPHWHIRGDANGQWSVRMSLNLDTSIAEQRRQESLALVISH